MIEDQLKQVMSAEADRLQVPRELAENVIHRGRRVRRTRRVGLGVAVVTGIVAAVLLPGAFIQSSRPDPAVTPDSTRASDAPYSTLPKGPPPRVPYTFGSRAKGGWLYDGETRVRIEPGLQISVISRVSAGWFVSRTDARNKHLLGIKRPSGSFTALGTPAGGYWTSSPDGSQVAFVAVDRKRKYRLVVFDVNTGMRKAASPPISRLSEIMGWNSHGIWYVSALSANTKMNRTYVWQPGQSPRLIPGADYLVVEQHPTRMVRIADSRCVEVVTLGSAGRLEPLRQYCGPGISGGDLATLSPDGKIIVLPDGTARPVDGGKTVRVRQSIMMPPEHMAWEDDTHVLLYDKEAVKRVRCNVRTGRCERVETPPAEYGSVATR